MPGSFVEAIAGLRAATMRPEVLCEEMPAPQRIAPHAIAVSGDVTVEGEDVGTGRLILLHDPDGNDAWDGTFRCVAYVRADLDPEMITDPLLAAVGWDWLTEALNAHGAHFRSPSGSVTKVATEGFGTMSGDETTAQIEIRASWTPCDEGGESHDVVPNVTAHVEALGELLCTAAGLEPVPDGVRSMPSRRGQRGRGH